MKYLHILEDGSTVVIPDTAPTDDDCYQISEGTLTVVRFHEGEFQYAEVDCEDVPDNDDDDDSDTHEEWHVTDWATI